jgi:hypothetical protein
MVLLMIGSLPVMTAAAPPVASPGGESTLVETSRATQDSSAASAITAERLPDGRLRLGPMILDDRRGVLEVPARVNMNQGMIEVLACAPWGKTHESLLTVEAEPYLIQVGLLLLFELPPKAVGMTAPVADIRTYKPQGPAVRLRILWADSTGREHDLPVQQWICRAGGKEPMREGDWVFSGSILTDAGFAAQTGGTVVATYVDPAAIVDNPRSEGQSDEAYWICPETVPVRGTPLTLCFVRTTGISEGKR